MAGQMMRFGEGGSFSGYLAQPADGVGPGVLVLHDLVLHHFLLDPVGGALSTDSPNRDRWAHRCDAGS